MFWDWLAKDVLVKVTGGDLIVMQLGAFIAGLLLGGSFMYLIKDTKNKKLPMKAAMLFLMLIAFVGCASNEVKSIKLDTPAKNICVQDFKSSDPAVGEIFKQVMKDELVQQGFTLTDANNADILITGFVSKSEGGWDTGGYIDTVMIVVKNRAGEIIDSTTFEQGHIAASYGGNPLVKLAKKLTKNLAKKLK